MWYTRRYTLGLIVKHVVQTKTGSFTYRRRVPKGLREALGKTEIKKVLGASHGQALKHYQAFHNEVERLLQSAQRSAKSPRTTPKTDYEVHREALRRLQEIGFDEIDGFGLDDDEVESLHRDVVGDELAKSYPIDPETGYPIISDKVVGRQIHILNSSQPIAERYRFSDAVTLYVDENVRGTVNE
ncbi:MAG: hypothetical protein ACI9XZ_004478, partial [Alphaproteobacteria bacterium]